MPRTSPDAVTVRPLRTQEDFHRCVELQYATWGEGFGECVPPSLLMAVQKVGGIAAGAFDAEGRLLGFVFGVSGVRDGRLAHWSDMLAVREEARGLGLGVQLKAYQRKQLLKLGIDVAYWTYDPLEARNAHININRLGARPIEYIRDMYGQATGSPLHAGLGTDRFLVKWELQHPRVRQALAGIRAPEPRTDSLVVNRQMAGGRLTPREPELSDIPRARVEIPSDIQAVKSNSPELARVWRSATRRAFLYYMERGYRVTGLARALEEDRCFYLLERGE